MTTHPVGLRFVPTDEELVVNHLKSKIVGCTDEDCFIPLLDDFYAWDPWDLPQVYQERSVVPSDGWQWFFLCPSPYQRQNNDSKIPRKTNSGAWKITRKIDDVRARGSKDLIGIKKSLTFYQGKKLNRSKTGWIMHEFHLNPELLDGNYSSLQMPFVLCRLKRQPSEKLDANTSYRGDSSNGINHDDGDPIVPQHGLPDDTNPGTFHETTMESLPQVNQSINNGPSNYYNSCTNYNPQPYMYEDDQSSYEATVESLPELQSLDDSLPNYCNSYSNYNPQPYVYEENQGNNLSGPWSIQDYY